jgi:hypothetical protein
MTSKREPPQRSKHLTPENPACKNRGELKAKVIKVSSDDRVEVWIQVAMFGTRYHPLKEKPSDFDTPKFGRDDASVCVKFDAGTSSESIICALNAVIAQIETDGLFGAS